MSGQYLALISSLMDLIFGKDVDLILNNFPAIVKNRKIGRKMGMRHTARYVQS